MRKTNIIFLSICLLLMASIAQAANVYVRAGAGGSGVSWSNALSDLPGTLVRGNTYYVADGSYSGYTFDTPNSGSTYITIKKATEADHGTETGWSSSYGDGQATFSSLTLVTSYLIFDGATRNESDWFETGSYGFFITRVYGSADTDTIGDYITIQYCEIGGSTITSTWYSGMPDEGIQIHGWNDHAHDWTIRKNYIRNIDGVPFQFNDAYNMTVEYNAVKNTWGKESVRGQNTATNVVIHHNVMLNSCIGNYGGPEGWHDQCTAFVALFTNGTETAEFNGLLVYGNVFANTIASGECTSTSGSIMAEANAKVYNNTIINYAYPSTTGTGGVRLFSWSGSDVRDNIFYYPNGMSYPCIAATCNNNSYYTSSPPFVSLSGSDYHLTQSLAGVSLEATYNTDLDGNTRGSDGTWDRGAYEYGGTPPPPPPPPTNTALSVSTLNPRYFKTLTKDGIYLTGSHTWDLVQGENWEPTEQTMTDYLDWIQSHGHNFVRLWANWGYTYQLPPMWNLSGGKAVMGDWNTTYWDALRAAVLQITDRGMYASVMIFGSGVGIKGNWTQNWWNPLNNTSTALASAFSTSNGMTFYTTNTAALNIQKAYAAKVIDTLNDQPNIMWEIQNEAALPESAAWQNTMMAYIRSYEATKDLQHIIVMSGEGGGGSSSDEAYLFNSTADAIAPDGLTPYTLAIGGDATYSTKPRFYDTDHVSGFSTPADAELYRKVIWRSFCKGMNPIFMDSYNNLMEPYNDGTIMAVFDPTRAAMGHTLSYANRMDMTATVPSTTFSTSGYALVNTGKTYLIYQPNVSTTYLYTLPTGTWAYELFNPVTGLVVESGTTSGGAHSSTTGSTDEVLFFYLNPSTAPIIDNLSPSGTLACTTNPLPVTLSLTTNIQAWARMNLNSDLAFVSMTDDFTNTGSTSHSEIKSLACGATYNYYVRVRNIDWDITGPEIISFTIASQGVAGPGGLRLTSGVRFGH